MTATRRRPSGLNAAAIRTWNHVTVLFFAGSLLALAGCSDSGSDTSSSKPSGAPPATSPSSTSSVTAEDAAVLVAYTRSWDAKTEAYQQASSTGTDVRKYTTFKALADIERNLSAMKEAGQVTTGNPVIHPKVVRVTDAKIPKATVTDCVDTAHWTLVNKATKKPVPLPTERLIKYVSTATLEKWGTKWMVTEWTAQDQTC
ncbi:hypothetical protein [Streptomyces sp. NPDC059489]|uniref:hypothetical protein n=1 Tax=Streptomyces sp. NPDC059489 TaxID=3346849 RepID=UPI00368774DA